MNGKLEQISVAMLEGMLPPLTKNELEVLLRMARLSSPLLIGTWEGQLLCVVGVIPKSLLSAEAYIWLYDTENIIHHRVAFARHAIRLIANLRQQYNRIFGHCLTEPSWRWLRSLGAVQTSPNTFEIISWPHH